MPNDWQWSHWFCCHHHTIIPIELRAPELVGPHHCHEEEGVEWEINVKLLLIPRIKSRIYGTTDTFSFVRNRHQNKFGQFVLLFSIISPLFRTNQFIMQNYERCGGDRQPAPWESNAQLVKNRELSLIQRRTKRDDCQTSKWTHQWSLLLLLLARWVCGHLLLWLLSFTVVGLREPNIVAQ